jgi:hypothetical protein
MESIEMQELRRDKSVQIGRRVKRELQWHKAKGSNKNFHD